MEPQLLAQLLLSVSALLLGVSVFYCCLLVSRRMMKWITNKRKSARNPFSSQVIKISTATIASDMIPLISGNTSKNDLISIIGSDGFYVHTENADTLLKGIIAICKHGCTIRYYILNSDDIDNSLLKFTKFKKENNLKKFEIITIDGEHKNPVLKNLCKKYLTLHPTLIEGNDGTALWLEGYHAPKSRYAYNIEFYSKLSVENNQNIKSKIKQFTEDFSIIYSSESTQVH